MARGSANIRRTSFSRIGGFVNCPRSANASKRSSGMLPHRKNDKRDATSMSLRRYVFGADPACFVTGGSRWTRRRKSGSTSIRSSAN